MVFIWLGMLLGYAAASDKLNVGWRTQPNPATPTTVVDQQLVVPERLSIRLTCFGFAPPTRFGTQRPGEPSLGACSAVTLLFSVFQSLQIMRRVKIEPKETRQGRCWPEERYRVSHQRLLGYSRRLPHCKTRRARPVRAPCNAASSPTFADVESKWPG